MRPAFQRLVHQIEWHNTRSKCFAPVSHQPPPLLVACKKKLLVYARVLPTTRGKIFEKRNGTLLQKLKFLIRAKSNNFLKVTVRWLCCQLQLIHTYSNLLCCGANIAQKWSERFSNERQCRPQVLCMIYSSPWINLFLLMAIRMVSGSILCSVRGKLTCVHMTSARNSNYELI